MASDASGDGYVALQAVRDDGSIVDWTIVDANSLVCDRWSWVVGDPVGTRLSQLEAAVTNSALHEAYRAALATGERQVAEIDLALPGGRGGWRRVTVVPVDADTVTVATRDIGRERYFETAAEQAKSSTNVFGGITRPHVPATRSEAIAEARFARGSATVLFLGAGIVTLANTLLSRLDHVNVSALRLTAVLTMIFGCALLLLPWDRHGRAIGNSIVIGVIAFLVLSDHFDHFSRSESAVAVYPVFFIIVIAWAGLTQGKGAATVSACLSGPALGGILASGGRGTIGWQCVIVTLPAAAVLGEVLSWSYRRATQLARLEASRRLHDSLTGLANRTMLTDRLAQALARSRRTGHPVAVLFVDLDRFKEVNDTLGHSAGDALLVETAARLNGLVRESDTVARLGGDEFVLLCDQLETSRDAIEIAQRVIDSIDAPFTCGESQARVTASVGIMLSIDGTETPDTMLRQADTAMYRAKDGGKARYELFDEAMQHWVAARLELEVALRRAVTGNELVLHYQPVLDADSGMVVSFEALVRWDRPGFGLVQPGEFIAIAEETGLILEIGTWVLDEACRQAAAWTTRWPDRRIGIAVNISSRQILKGKLTDTVTSALARSGLDPTLLTLELTETTLIDDALTAEAVLQELRGYGVNLALDDFGTGYSSLTYLRTFPINIIKIDQSFVRTIGTEREDTAIVAAVVALARNLNLKVVAEGIETPEQLATLMYLNCDLLQGYLFARPAPLEDVPALVEGAGLNLSNLSDIAD